MNICKFFALAILIFLIPQISMANEVNHLLKDKIIKASKSFEANNSVKDILEVQFNTLFNEDLPPHIRKKLIMRH